MAQAIGKIGFLNGDEVSIEIFNSNINCNAVYEVLRVLNGKPLFFEEHFQRLVRSAELASIEVQLFASDVLLSIKHLIEKNNIITGNVWIQINDNKQLFVFQIKHTYPPSYVYEQGVKTITILAEREQAEVKQSDVKSKIEKVINTQHHEDDIYEFLLVNHFGEITEGSRSNVFFIREGILYTSPDNQVLKGITRQKIIEIAIHEKLPIKFKSIKEADLGNYENAFLTGTSPKVLPISFINSIGFNTKNPLLQRVISLYNAEIENYLNKFQLF